MVDDVFHLEGVDRDAGALSGGVHERDSSGRWVGTRLVPLAAAATAVLAAVFLPLWPVSGLPVLALAAVLIVVSGLWIGETRDFS